MIDLGLNEHVFPFYGYPVSERANMLANCHVNLSASIVWRKNPTCRRTATPKELRTTQTFSQRSEVEIVVIGETETSPTKNLAVLQVTGGKKTMVEERGNVDKECLVVSSQECLLSSSDERSEGLEKFLRDKLESFCGEGIENIVEVDPDGVLDLLDATLMDRGNLGSGVVTVDDEFPRSRVDDILRSELGGKNIGRGSKRPLCDVDIGLADERPSKSVAFDFDDAGGRLFSERCTLVGVSYAGQSFPSSSRPDDTDYGTSELESIARRRVGDLSGGRVCETAESDVPGFILCRLLQSCLIVIVWRVFFRSNHVPVGRQMRFWASLEQK